ncbi:MAG: elongation factor G, partial [Chloroflexota bacterium]|nr:elongation factor G [Chloroflexota bacterium]
VSDFDPDEIRRRMSISAAVAPLEWRDTKINLIDTPGYTDFVGEVKAAIRVAEAALIVADAASPIEIGTENGWKFATEANVARMIFVNRMSRENADFDRTVEQLRAAFGPTVLPVQYPIGREKDFRGLVDLLHQEAHIYQDDTTGKSVVEPIPAEVAEQAAKYRQMLVEQVAEQDEDLMVRYLEDQELSIEDLIPTLRKAVRKGRLVPVFAGSSTQNRGIDLLLDQLLEMAPHASPHDKGWVNADGDGTSLQALIFKTVADPHVGRVSYFRVFSGSLDANSHIYNSVREQGERIGQVFYVRGKEHIPADSIGTGDIGAVGKLAHSQTNDTLCADGASIRAEPIRFPLPAYSAAIHPQTKSDLDKLGQAMQRLVEEDPTLQLSRDPITGESILSGMGESHVQISVDRMSRRFGVNVDIGLPRVAYRETITAKTTSEYKHKKQTGGAGQYGHVFLELEPLQEGEFEFAERVVGGAVPKNFFPAVEKGVREALESGPVAGYPVVNVKVTLYDGSYHDVDSNEMAFKIASKEAFKKGVLQAKPTLLEPILLISITVPDQYTGDVMSDLNSKRAHVNGMNPGDNGSTTIEAAIPAAEAQRYATDLKSITQGRGSFTTEFSHYQPVPPNVAEQIKAQAAREAEGQAA